jgi:maleylacetate reductase
LFDLSHAQTHTILLPHALADNAVAAPKAVAGVAQAMGVVDPMQGLFDLAVRVGAPTALRDIGMRQSGIVEASELAMANPYWNPRKLDRQALQDLIARAWAGERPQS